MPNFSHSGNPVYNQTALLNRISELEEENKRLRAALRSIEHDAKLKADPARAHSSHMSYGELLSGYSALAGLARHALKGARNEHSSQT